MKHTCHRQTWEQTLLQLLTGVTPGVTPRLNSPKDLQGRLAGSRPLGVGLERDVTALRSKGSVTCHNRSKAQSTGPQSVTVSRTHPRGTV